MGDLFGSYIRSRRLKLQESDPSYSIRGVAKRIGIHHSYLSKIERGEPATLSEKRLVTLATVLGENPDVLLAMNGRLSDEVTRSIIKNPDLFSSFLETYKASSVHNAEAAAELCEKSRSLRDWCVFMVGEDRRVRWSNGHPMIAHTNKDKHCHQLLFCRDEPCDRCPLASGNRPGQGFLNDIVRDNGEVWRIGAVRLPDQEGRDGCMALHMAVNLTGAALPDLNKIDAERMFFHDIKSSLAGIVALARQIAPTLGEERNLMELITITGERLLRQVTDHDVLLALESGTYRYEPREFDLASMIRQETALPRALAAQRGVTVTLLRNEGTLAEGDVVRAHGDDRLLSRALMNMVHNAAEASSNGGTVTVRLLDGDPLAVEIANDCAVPEQIRDTFFDKYVTAGKKDGAGLGAYSVRLIAEAMGGSVSMTTSDTEGTKICLLLPCPPY